MSDNSKSRPALKLKRSEVKFDSSYLNPVVRKPIVFDIDKVETAAVKSYSVVNTMDKPNNISKQSIKPKAILTARYTADVNLSDPAGLKTVNLQHQNQIKTNNCSK